MKTTTAGEAKSESKHCRMVGWYDPLQLIKTGSDVAASTLFGRRADYRMLDVQIGRTNVDQSLARLEVSAQDEDTLHSLLVDLQAQGANRIHVGDAIRPVG